MIISFKFVHYCSLTFNIIVLYLIKHLYIRALCKSFDFSKTKCLPLLIRPIIVYSSYVQSQRKQLSQSVNHDHILSVQTHDAYQSSTKYSNG